MRFLLVLLVGASTIGGTSVMEGRSDPIPIPGNPRPAPEDSAETVRLYSRFSRKLRAHLRAATSLEDLDGRFKEVSSHLREIKETAMRRADDKDARRIWRRFDIIHSEVEIMYDKMSDVLGKKKLPDREGIDEWMIFGME